MPSNFDKESSLESDIEERAPNQRSESSSYQYNHNQYQSNVHIYASNTKVTASADPNFTTATQGSTFAGNKTDGDSTALIGTLLYDTTEYNTSTTQIYAPPVKSYSVPQAAAQESPSLTAGFSTGLCQERRSILETFTTHQETVEFSRGGTTIEATEEIAEAEEVEDALVGMAGYLSQNHSYRGTGAKPNGRISICHRTEPISLTNDHAFMEPGTIITISQEEEGNISGRSMIIMVKTTEGLFECLSHSDMSKRLPPLIPIAHVPVHVKGNAPEDRKPDYKAYISIVLDSENSTLRKNSLINCQHVWTVGRGVRFSVEGEVENFKDLLAAFGNIQKKLYKEIRQQFGVED
ncbi:hypothetical protein HYALB_00005785 [Hymenoscyphus albidus]|uniref:Uncharacterized protein n=1 Tax=Hymenoscyphus albidus TaxID=595503 RepID=A0A9N9LR49_9HELO|nr:hypothetical protein HYALB_00005785 [Hymenoscyphus albidus]